MVGKARNGLRETCFSGDGSYFGPTQLGFNENQDAGSITEAAGLKANETTGIRELYRAISEFRKTESGLNFERYKKSKSECELWKKFKK